MDPALVFYSELSAVKVGGDHGMQSSVLPCVYEIIEAGDGELIYKLGSEIVDYKELALHVFFSLGIVLSVASSEAVVLKRADDVLRAVIEHLDSARYERARNGRGYVRLSRSRLAEKKEGVR